MGCRRRVNMNEWKSRGPMMHEDESSVLSERVSVPLIKRSRDSASFRKRCSAVDKLIQIDFGMSARVGPRYETTETFAASYRDWRPSSLGKWTIRFYKYR